MSCQLASSDVLAMGQAARHYVGPTGAELASAGTKRPGFKC
jgi:hypothetical protein